MGFNQTILDALDAQLNGSNSKPISQTFLQTIKVSGHPHFNFAASHAFLMELNPSA